MIYLISAATLLMLGYMLWRASVRLRHDRVRTHRHLTRGQFAFRPRERIRFLLGRSFRLAEDKAEWEGPLISSLDEAAAERVGAKAPPGRQSGAGD